MAKDENYHREHHHAEEAIKLVFRGLIPIIFLISGVVLLALRIPGWSIFLGLPITIFGTVFLIYTYDEVVRKTFAPMPTKLAKCSVCGKETPLFPDDDPQDTTCPVCKKDVRRGIKTA